MTDLRSLVIALVLLCQLALRFTPCPTPLASVLPVASAESVKSADSTRAAVARSVPAPPPDHAGDHGHGHDGGHAHHADRSSPQPVAHAETARAPDPRADGLSAPCPCGCSQHAEGLRVRVTPASFVPPFVPALVLAPARWTPLDPLSGLPPAPTQRVAHVPISA